MTGFIFSTGLAPTTCNSSGSFNAIFFCKRMVRTLLMISLAVSNFSIMNWDGFLSHINSMSQYDDTKNFWLSLYYIYQDNLNEAQTYYDNIARNEENTTGISYLECLICYKQGDIDLAKTKMKDIYPKLKYPVLKQIADQMFYKN